MRVPSLTTSMRANAVFSAISGVAAIGLAVFADRGLGLEPWLLGVLGIGLVVYGIQLTIWVRSARLTVPGARIATAADAAWVVTAAVILTAYPSAMDTTGRIVLAVVSLVVADFAIMQALGLRRLRLRNPRKCSYLAPRNFQPTKAH